MKYRAARPRKESYEARETLDEERYCRKRHEYITHALELSSFILSFPMENALLAFNVAPGRERRAAYRPD